MVVADPNTDETHHDLRQVAEAFVRLEAELGSMDGVATSDAIAHIAVDRLPGATCASVTSYERGRFRTVVATDETARSADEIQYALGSGPCLDAILEDTLYRPRDLRHDDRWPEYGERVSSELGLLSMLSYRLGHDGGDSLDGLNIYSDEVAGFDERAELLGLMLATHGAMAITVSANRAEVDNLHKALLSSREIGVAMGVLMARHRVTREEAFALLRMTSQDTNRKLRDVALEVSDTGVLPPMGRGRPARGDARTDPATDGD